MRGNNIHWPRVVVAVFNAAVAVGILLTATETITYAAPTPPERAISSISASPVLTITPDALTFQAELITSTVQTQTLYLSVDSPITWSIAISPSAQVQPIVTPISGTADATVTVQIDLHAITSTGAYHADLIITAEPTTTSGVPFTVPVDVIVVTPTYQIYLPLIAQNFVRHLQADRSAAGIGFCRFSGIRRPRKHAINARKASTASSIAARCIGTKLRLARIDSAARLRLEQAGHQHRGRHQSRSGPCCRS